MLRFYCGLNLLAALEGEEHRIFDRRVRTVDDTVTWMGDKLLAWFQAGFNSLRPVVVVFGGSTGREQ